MEWTRVFNTSRYFGSAGRRLQQWTTTDVIKTKIMTMCIWRSTNDTRKKQMHRNRDYPLWIQFRLFSKVDTNLLLPRTDRPATVTLVWIGGITPMPPKKSNTRHFRGMSSIVLVLYLPSSCLFRKKSIHFRTAHPIRTIDTKFWE